MIRNLIAGLIVSLILSYNAFAGEIVPHIFQSGTPARASEVNANFDALEKAMPRIKTTYLHDLYINSPYPNITTVTNIQFTPPRPHGAILVFASGTVCISNHIQGPRQGVGLKVSDSSGDISDGPGAALFEIAGSHPSMESWDRACAPFNIMRVFNINSTSPITIYLNGTVISSDKSNYPTGRVAHVNLTAIYLPFVLP